MGQGNNFNKGFLVGFFAGGAFGAALALLFAPKSGKELRQDIRDRSEEYLEEADKYISEAKDKAVDLINEGKKRSDKLIKDAKDKSDQLMKDAEKVYKDAKGKVSDSYKTGKESFDQKRDQL
ncbi:MAG: YtxH domain-containing protein, partial [Ignavibacteriaceae bacterium]|nr:YtxH domain-containing protein [Ignavibacteriaceae bacterium]